MPTSADILMITHDRPEYTQLSLKRLLDTCDESVRVWVWHNGTHRATLDVVRSFLDHPRIHKFYHSEENSKLNPPTNWLWSNSAGDYVGKVDDDCLVPRGWIELLCDAHELNPQLGVIGCWHYLDGDAPQELCERRVIDLQGHRLLKNLWIGGSGYLIKRACIQAQGGLRKQQSFSNYCIRLASRGWVNGWYFPFLFQDHMDDPRSEHTTFRTDADVVAMGGLTNAKFNCRTIDDILNLQQAGLERILHSSLDPRDYVGVTARLRRVVKRVIGRRRN